ncbi:MAG: SCO family protein [Gemmatimonas sp.]
MAFPSRIRTLPRVLFVALAACSVLAACSREPAWRGTPVTPARMVPAMSFADSTGAERPLRPASARATMVFFGYTNCPDVCPTTMADWVRVKNVLGDKVDGVQFVFVSVDPARDTPAVSQRYAAQFDPTFIGLSGDAATTAAIQKAFGVASGKQPTLANGEYLVAHPAQTFLMDADGQVRVSYDFGAGWDVMAADLTTLLK